MFKKLVSAVTAVSLTVMQVIVPLTASAAALKDETDSCGTGVSYTLSDTDSNGVFDTLTISGEGSMQDYADTSAPWYTHRNNIMKFPRKVIHILMANAPYAVKKARIMFLLLLTLWLLIL